MKILVDVDGVQADLVPAFLGVLQQLTGRLAMRKQWTDWDPVKCGVCADELEARATFAAMGSHVHALPEIEDAMRGIKTLRAHGHHVVALTAPIFTPDWLHGRATWLTRRGYTDRTIVFTRDKTLVPGDVLVEDNPEYADAWAVANPASTAILFDQPWNRENYEFSENVIRAYCWEEVLEIIGGLTP